MHLDVRLVPFGPCDFCLLELLSGEMSRRKGMQRLIDAGAVVPLCEHHYDGASRIPGAHRISDPAGLEPAE